MNATSHRRTPGLPIPPILPAPTHRASPQPVDLCRRGRPIIAALSIWLQPVGNIPGLVGDGAAGLGQTMLIVSLTSWSGCVPWLTWLAYRMRIGADRQQLQIVRLAATHGAG